MVPGLLLVLLALAPAAHAQEPRLAITGRPGILFDSLHDGCEAIDMPDINPRVFRDDKGQIVFFALHFVNRSLRGPDLDHLKLDCHVALPSHFDPEPAHYDDRSYITATWTTDGRNVAALVHHEYHADDHGRCVGETGLACWYNSILAYQSTDGGTSFRKDQPLVVASAPFGEDVEQGRHRGFFNPSNIFSDGTHEYFFAATTGWQGQRYGACLFRTDKPANPASWRAFDGQGFNIRYADPYAAKAVAPNPCAPIDPFVFPVGAVVRDRTSHLWIAVFQAARTISPSRSKASIMPAPATSCTGARPNFCFPARRSFLIFARPEPRSSPIRHFSMRTLQVAILTMSRTTSISISR